MRHLFCAIFLLLAAGSTCAKQDSVLQKNHLKHFSTDSVWMIGKQNRYFLMFDAVLYMNKPVSVRLTKDNERVAGRYIGMLNADTLLLQNKKGDTLQIAMQSITRIWKNHLARKIGVVFLTSTGTTLAALGTYLIVDYGLNPLGVIFVGIFIIGPGAALVGLATKLVRKANFPVKNARLTAVKISKNELKNNLKTKIAMTKVLHNLAGKNAIKSYVE